MTTLETPSEWLTMGRVGVIRLTGKRGGFTIVDPERVDELNQRRWCNTGGYAGSAIRTGNKTISLMMHRVVFGAETGKFIDHRNREKLDNRISNLRYATKSQNAANSKKQVKSAGKSASIVSEFRGVHWDKGAWTVKIKANGTKFYLGRFQSEVDAAKAYNSAALQHFGEFAKLNAIP